MRTSYKEGRIYDHLRKQKVCYKVCFFKSIIP